MLKKSGYSYKRNLYNYKRKAISVAKDLEYPKEIIEKIYVCQTEDEISKIMTCARKRMED